MVPPARSKGIRLLSQQPRPPAITGWEPFELKAHDLVQRYLTTAERKFQRDYRLLEHHFKSHHKPAQQPEERRKSDNRQTIGSRTRTNPKNPLLQQRTGESIDSERNEYPPPPGYVAEPIIPGVYRPKHPAYEGPPPKRHS